MARRWRRSSGNIDAHAPGELALEELVQLAFDLAPKTLDDDVVARLVRLDRGWNRFTNHVLHVNEMRDRQQTGRERNRNAHFAKPAAPPPKSVSHELEQLVGADGCNRYDRRLVANGRANEAIAVTPQ